MQEEKSLSGSSSRARLRGDAMRSRRSRVPGGARREGQRHCSVALAQVVVGGFAGGLGGCLIPVARAGCAVAGAAT